MLSVVFILSEDFSFQWGIEPNSIHSYSCAHVGADCAGRPVLVGLDHLMQTLDTFQILSFCFSIVAM